MLSRKFKKESGTALSFSRLGRCYMRLLKPMTYGSVWHAATGVRRSASSLSPPSACPPRFCLAPPASRCRRRGPV